MKKCGVRIVYEEDLEDEEQIKVEQHSNQSCAETEDIDEDDDSAAVGSVIKRKRSVYEETQEGPQPKRIQKFFNSIMGRPGRKN